VSGKNPKRLPRSGVDEYGRSPLHLAVIDGDARLVADLLASGMHTDAQDDNGWTALHFAADRSDAPIARLLLAHGAAVDIQDANGNTALSNAVFSSRGVGETILLLRQAGADINLANRHGVSPLSLARTIANFDVSRYFDDQSGANEA